jgi:hypothetical protein
LSAQIDDLQSAARALRDWYSEMQIEGYLAMRRGRSLSFHELDLRGESL